MDNISEKYYLRDLFDPYCAEYKEISDEQRINKLRQIFETEGEDAIHKAVRDHWDWMIHLNKNPTSSELRDGLIAIIEELLRLDPLHRKALNSNETKIS